MPKRKNTITRFIEDIVDDTKDLVDDLLDRAKDLEIDARDAAKKSMDDDETSAADVADLQRALASLSIKVDQLVELQLAASTPTVPASPAGKAAVRTTAA